MCQNVSGLPNKGLSYMFLALLLGMDCDFLARRVIVPFYRSKGMTYILRHMGGLHRKAWMLVEA
jgi:hypothetical protein